MHIVWNEDNRPYENSIRGDFGNAIIVVAPLPNGLYSVRLHKDEQVKWFGPLADGLILDWPLLGPLVRATVISANRNASLLLTKGVWKHP